LLQYLIVVKIGRLIARLAGPRAGALPGRLDTCQQLADGATVPAFDVLRAQSFAGQFWVAVAFGFLLPAFPVLGVFALARPGLLAREIAAGVLLVLGGFMTCALAQVPALTIRLGGTMTGLRRMRRQFGRAGQRPLPAGSFGLPKRRDFWIACAIALAGYAVIAYLGFLARGW